MAPETGWLMDIHAMHGSGSMIVIMIQRHIMPAGEEGSMTAAPILSHIQCKKLLHFKIFIYFMFIVSEDCIDYCFMHIR